MIILLTAILLVLQDPFETDPKEVLAAAKAVKTEPGAAVVVLFNDTRWTFQADGRAESRTRQSYRVLTEEGAREYATVSADWAPWYQEKPAIRARVITADGAAHPLRPGTLTENPVASSNPDIFTDRRMITGPLPSVAAGAVVEVETVTRQTRPFFDRGVVTYHHFPNDASVQRERLVLDAPDGFDVRYLVRLLPDLKPTRESANGRIVTTFDGGPFPARDPGELFAPSDVPQSRYVAFTTGKSWAEVAKRYRDIVEAQIAKADLQPLGELPPADLPRDERVARILAAIHAKVRYTSLALGEASIVPRPPAETLQRGYGDCKDKSSLLVAALRAAGVEARVAILLTGPGPDVEPELPGFGAFDHAIVRVGADLWIDPADKFSRPGSLPLPDQDRQALLAAPDTTSLVRTPASAPRDNIDLKIREFHLADYGPARVVETLRPSGAHERNLRQLVEQDRKNVDQYLENYASTVFLAKKVVNATYGAANDLARPIELRFEAPEAGRGQTDLREAVVAIPVENLFRDLPWFLRDGEAKERKKDVVLHQPFVTEWRYRIVPPPGFHPRPFPASEKTALGPSMLVQEYSKLDDGSVAAVFRFDAGKRRMTAEESAELRKGIDRIKQDGVLLIGFTSIGGDHLEAGRIREALTEYRKLADAHPKKALYRALIARALLSGGLGDAARGDARKAVEIEPGSIVAHQTLGWILQHDLIGRRFEKGWDLKGAEAAFRETLKIKPGHLENTLDLAIMLEHDESGQRYTTGARLGDAIDLYKSVLKEIGGTAFENNLDWALLWGRKFKELAERQKKPSTATGRTLLLTARAALDGGDAALTHAARTMGDDENRRAVVAQAGELLLRLRYYPEAGALLSAAARGAADAANLLGRADRLRKTKRWDKAPDDAGDPSSPVKQLYFHAMGREFKAEPVKSIISRYAISEDSTREFETMHSVIVEMTRKQGVPLEVGRDLTLSLMEAEVDGDDVTGYRIRVPPVMGARSPQLWFLNREDGKLKLLARGEGALGRLALDLLQAGEVEKARKWLDWWADELPEGAARDPLEADPFAVLWKKGAEAASLRRAAAAISGGGAAAFKVLEEARKEEADAKMRYAIDHALAQGYLHEKKHEEAGATALRMLEAEPESNPAFYLRARALEKQRKWAELTALCDDQLKRKPKSLYVLHTVQHLEMVKGRQAASMDLGRRMIRMGQSDPGIYNNLAWAALLEGKPEAALQDAQKAAMNSQGRADHILHTLATVYADLGRPVEARDVLLQTFKSRIHSEPEVHDWYVLGRIAEEYGARDAAVAAYRRTASAEGADLPSSTNQLSLRRLKLMDEK